MAESAERIIKKVSVSLLLFGIFLFASVSPALADSPTIIHGHIEHLAGFWVDIGCAKSFNFNEIMETYDIDGYDKWIQLDKNGNYEVTFPKNQCDTGASVYFANIYSFLNLECLTPTSCRWARLEADNIMMSKSVPVNDSRDVQADFTVDPLLPYLVPEYNPLTFILAIVGSFGLFLYFKKRNKNPLLQCSN